MTDLSKRLREPLVLSILIIALAGWIAFFAMWINAANQGGQQQQVIAELTAERDDVAARLTEREADGTLADTEAQLATAQQDLAAVTASRDNLNTELAQRESELATATEELETLRADAAAVEQQLADA
ncbi:MAG: hypothetical protein KJ944_11240, partial [Alphaproteobacteria bacterium]|nr:hypothetical protein [Alphaproteobacteria bacterium]